jgi:DNA-directed RNA polymerase specialized sigma24 family protein
MFVVAKCRAIDQLRRPDRHHVSAASDDLLAAPRADAADWEAIVQRCAARLSPRQMLLLTRRFELALTLRELAAELFPTDDRSDNGRISAIHRELETAREDLRRWLGEEGLDPHRW